jgi:DNA-binding CsgD family transcriptional regulator
MVPIRDAELFVDALNAAAEIEGGPQPRIEMLLRTLHKLVRRDTRSAIWLLDHLDRPLPRIVDRYVVRSSWDGTPPQDLVALQRAIDNAGPMLEIMLPSILARIRTPFTMVMSQSSEAEWFRRVFVPEFLTPMGYADAITSMWAESDARAVMLGTLRRSSDPPFTGNDVMFVSLMLRAAAPLIDRELFRSPEALDQRRLSRRQQEVLLMLLSGDSEKEIAARLSRSIHTIHTFVGQIYELFDVQSRGELMAMFIDKKVLERSSVGSSS